MRNNVVYERAFEFSVAIIDLYKHLTNDKKEYILSKQLVRSGTSIGANIKESEHAQSKRDFLSKMNIALKEANESEYWIELLLAAKYLDETRGKEILGQLVELKKILHKIVKTTKQNLNIEKL